MAEAQAYQPRLKTHYNTVVRDALKEKFNLANTMQVPALEKIVLNMGIGETTQDTKKINSAFEDLQAIAGQRVEHLGSQKRHKHRVGRSKFIVSIPCSPNAHAQARIRSHTPHAGTQ